MNDNAKESSPCLYWITAPIIKQYGSVRAFPWEDWWSKWQAQWADVGVFYIVSNPGWSALIPGVLKIGKSNSIREFRMGGYNGDNVTDVFIEYSVICTNVTKLEDHMKERFKGQRAVFGKKEWLKATKNDIIQATQSVLKLDSTSMAELGVPIYHFDYVVPPPLVQICEPLREHTYLMQSASPYTVQEKIYVSLFQQQHQWEDHLPPDKIHLVPLVPNLLLPLSLLERYLNGEQLLAFPKNLSFEVNVEQEEDWTNMNLEPCSWQPSDATTENPWSSFCSQLIALVQVQEDPDEDMPHWKDVRKTDLSKKIAWTPREEFILLRAIKNSPAPICWNTVYSSHQSDFHPLRRPRDLNNKWTYMNKRRPDLIWENIETTKRVILDPASYVKRKRRKIDELDPKELWHCDNCAKKYCKYSGVSIIEHKARCSE